MVEFLLFTQTGITLGENKIHQAPRIKGKSKGKLINVRQKKEGLRCFYHFFSL